MKIHILPILSDNYTYILEGREGTIAVMDPGEAEPVIHFLESRSLTLTYILNTHHHRDHTDGNMALKNRYGAKIIGPHAEKQRIKGIDATLRGGDVFDLDGEELHIISTPGHTMDGIAFHAPASSAAFTGDTLFAMGCGRLFEGTPAQMFDSLQKLAALPDETKIYPGHEYTLANAEFCAREEPDDDAIQNRLQDIKNMRAHDEPTIPTTIALEKETNSFLRAPTADAFAEVRARKDAS